MELFKLSKCTNTISFTAFKKEHICQTVTCLPISLLQKCQLLNFVTVTRGTHYSYLRSSDLGAVDVVDGLQEVMCLVYDDNVVLELYSTRLPG